MSLAEDIGSGDVTTEAIVDVKQQGIAEIRAKQSLVVAGMDVSRLTFKEVDPDLQFFPEVKDGECVPMGTVLATTKGSVKHLLAAERVVLNFLQRLSGIATWTTRFVDAVRETKTKILDTRKTTPGWRTLEKYAVRIGGGNNHRVGLFDRYLVKGNHIQIAGSIKEALQRVLAHKKPGLLVELEVRNLTELKEGLSFPVDIIMCDNFSLENLRQAKMLVKGKVLLEASGGVSLENVAMVAATGVDFISVGALTHSAPAADIHMTLRLA